jgi:cytochrome c-type biogenesis protein CcmH
MKLFVIAIIFILSFSSQATEDQIIFKSEQQKSTYIEVIAELRCPKCQNQNIADSNAVVAKDMRVKVKALLDEGKNKQQVIDYMINRYGQFAHYQPPFNFATSSLWLLPIGFILFAVFVQINRSKSESEPHGNTSELDDELAQLLVNPLDAEEQGVDNILNEDDTIDKKDKR